MENYIHPAAITWITGYNIEITDDNDVVGSLCRILRKKKPEVKAMLSEEVAPQMTVGEIYERDPKGEIRGWLQEIVSLDEKP
jgi:hypothetical protein